MWTARQQKLHGMRRIDDPIKSTVSAGDIGISVPLPRRWPQDDRVKYHLQQHDSRLLIHETLLDAVYAMDGV